jgi:hypothetical protein
MNITGLFVAATAALGVAIHLGDDHSANQGALPERLRLLERGLADAGVHDEHHQVLLGGVRDLPHLLQERGLLPVAPTRSRPRS